MNIIIHDGNEKKNKGALTCSTYQPRCLVCSTCVEDKHGH